MNWFQAVLFGIISGISEFLPISASAHKAIALQLFGVDGIDPLRDLIVHIAVAAALITAAANLLETIRRERRMAANGTRVYNQVYRGNMDYRLVRSAAIPMLLVFLVLSYIIKRVSLPLIALFLLINGIILYLPNRMLRGNKDARSMTRFDGILIGLGSAASAFTGISGIGMNVSIATMRGADQSHAVNWALLLSLPMLVLQILMDIISIFINLHSITLSAGFLGYVLIALFAYAAGYLAVGLIRFLGVKIGYSAFSYYCWGAALFSFSLYLY